MSKNKSLYRPAVSAKIKQELHDEAGGKCANPGCPTRVTENHHIKEWHVYRTHDAKDMIAICPTCHHHAHHGKLKIDEAAIRSWKRLRVTPSNAGHLYIEPGPPPRMLMGRIYLARKSGDGALVFRLSERNQVSFRILPGNLMMTSLVISDPVGEPLVEVRENHLTHSLREGVEFDSRPGRLRVTVAATGEFVPRAMIDLYQASNPPAASSKMIELRY